MFTLQPALFSQRNQRANGRLSWQQKYICSLCTGDRTQDLCDTETLVVTLVGSARNIFINIHIYRTGHTFTDTLIHLCNKTLGQYANVVPWPSWQCGNTGTMFCRLLLSRLSVTIQHCNSSLTSQSGEAKNKQHLDVFLAQDLYRFSRLNLHHKTFYRSLFSFCNATQ